MIFYGVKDILITELKQLIANFDLNDIKTKIQKLIVDLNTEMPETFGLFFPTENRVVLLKNSYNSITTQNTRLNSDMAVEMGERLDNYILNRQKFKNLTDDELNILITTVTPVSIMPLNVNKS